MEKEKVVRLGVSLPSDLLRPFDRLVERRGYQSRSEAIRDLIRRTLIEEEWKESASDVAGTLTLVYDHHNCLEVLVLRGPAREIERLADRIIACNGVKHGVFVPSTTGTTIA